MSDVHTITGQRVEPTPRLVRKQKLDQISILTLRVFSVLGHEAVVEVVDHRRPNSDLSIGDRLTFSIADSCGSCEFCQKGLNQKCFKLFKVFSKKLS